MQKHTINEVGNKYNRLFVSNMNETKCDECNYCYSYYRGEIKKLCLLDVEHSDFSSSSPDWCPLKKKEE